MEGFSWILFFRLMESRAFLLVFSLRVGIPTLISSYSRRSLPRKRSGDPPPISSSGAMHPVIVLKVADDRFQIGLSGSQPLETEGLFVRALGLSLPGNRHLGNLLQELGSLSSLLRFSSTPPASSEEVLWPLPNPPEPLPCSPPKPAVRIFPMGHHEPVGIDRQGDLHPVFIPLALLVLGDAGDMRTVSALDPLLLYRTFLNPVD